MRKLLLSGAACLSAVPLMLLGCAKGDKAATLRPQAFYAQKDQSRFSGGGDVTVNRRVEQSAPPKIATAETPPQAQPVPTTRPVTATTATTTSPVTGLASGSFIVLGTVVAEANGQPVYADRILAKLEDALAANAKRLEPPQFQAAAQGLIEQAVMEQVTDELEFAAAQRNTTPEDQQLAAGATTMWRQKEITKAGGSEAVARAKSLEDGMEFDERTRQQYRRHLIQIYYMKHVWPKVQVSADDVRRFYDQNVDNLYAEKSSVRFRAVRINLKPSGKEKAWATATEFLKKVRSGYDFANLAGSPEYNDNSMWRENKGYRELVETKDATGKTAREGVWTERGTLAAEELEKAVFALNPGEISDIIETRDALYVAKLEEKKGGTVRPFEDLKVQADIRDRMEREQRMALRAKEQLKLRDAKYWSVDKKNLQLTVDMAMQKYSEWARANSATSSTNAR
jgi:hypothetical protein